MSNRKKWIIAAVVSSFVILVIILATEAYLGRAETLAPLIIGFFVIILLARAVLALAPDAKKQLLEAGTKQTIDGNSCPKCSRNALYLTKRGFSFGKAAAGAAVTTAFGNPFVGVLAGFIGTNRAMVECVYCGAKYRVAK